MHNYFTIETEAESRRLQFERTAAADARAAQASRASRLQHWSPRRFRTSVATSTRSLPATPIGALMELPRVPRPVAC